MKAAAMDPHHHRQMRVDRLRRGSDVEREAILAHGVGQARMRLLHADRPVVGGIANALPRPRGLWLSPAQRPDWRRRVRNPTKNAERRSETTEVSLLYADDGVFGGSSDRWSDLGA